MLLDYLAAFAQTKLPLRARIVLTLCSIEADSQEVPVSQRDLAAALQLEHTWSLRKAMDELEAQRLIGRIAGRGSRPETFWLRPPEEWLEPRWVTDRKRGLRVVAWLAGRRERERALFALEKSSALGPFVRKEKAAHKSRRNSLSALRGATHKFDPTALDSAARYRAPLSSSSHPNPAPLGSGVGDRENNDEIGLTPRQEELAQAFMEGTQAKYLRGSPLRRLIAIEQQANGSFAAIVERARDPFGPATFDERLAELLAYAKAGPVDERRTLVTELTRAELEEDLELASELRARLATLASCETED